MGLFDGLAGQLLSSLGPAASQNSNLLPHMLELLQGQGQGISGLVSAFHNNGMGNLLSSWISTGPNLPISASQIEQVFGGSFIQQLAGKAGISPDVASSQLANLLPVVVDKLTPNGTMPQGSDLLGQGLSLLKGKLF